MAYNFNTTNKPEYDLNASLIDETINLYGITVKLMHVTRINKEDVIFGDYSHISVNNDDTFEISALPETAEEWDNIATNFSEFGLFTNETCNLFISRKTMETIYPNIDLSKGFNQIIGNLVAFPNNRLMEITDIQFEVPGVNNLFVNTNTKSAYKLYCKQYNVKLNDELPAETITHSEQPENYGGLDSYFAELLDEKIEQDVKSSVENTVETIIKNADVNGNDIKVQKPIISRLEDSVFGDF